MTYQEARDRATELIGIPRDQLLEVDAVLLQGFFATHLRSIWRAAPWPETTDVGEFTPVERLIQKTTLIGDVFWVATDNMRETTRGRILRHWHNATTIEIYEQRETVWIFYRLPVPDLAALSGTSLLNYVIADRLALPLLHKAAASLASCLGKKDFAVENRALGEMCLAEEAAVFLGEERQL